METMTLAMVVAALRERGSAYGLVNPEEYHKWKPLLAAEFGCPCVSKSSLCDFDASPFRFRYNELNHVRKESAGLRMGSVVDCMVLTPELYDKTFSCEEVNLRTKEGKERKAELEAEGITLIKPEEEVQALQVRTQALQHLDFLGLTLGETFDSQVGLFVYVAEIDGAPLATPLIVTGMIDILPRAGFATADALWDLKTTAKDPSDSQQLCYAMEDYHYGVGAALYLDLYNICTGESRSRFGHLFVGTELPAMSRAVWIGEGELEVYRHDYKAMLRRYATAAAQDFWGEPTLPEVYYQPTKREAMRMGNVMFGGQR